MRPTRAGEPGEPVNEKLPSENRGGSLEQDWSGDDQDWWNWYMTLASNDDQPLELGRGPGLPDVAPASDEVLVAELEEPYPLENGMVAAFRRDGFVKLAGVLSPPVVRRLAEHLDVLLRREHGDDVAGRFTALEQMWCHDEVMRAVALSRRIGDLAATLLGERAVRLYHDNALSKEPGCGRTPWHHDAEHFPLDTGQSVTAWIPLSAIPGRMGPLSFARGREVRELVADVEFDRVGTSYDASVAARFAELGVAVEAGPFAVGEVSFHSALCFHTAGPNLTEQPRRALATTYYAAGARVVSAPTLVSGTWREFLPGVEPGEVAASPLNPVVGGGAVDLQPQTRSAAKVSQSSTDPPS